MKKPNYTKGPLKINTVFNSKGIAIPKVFDSKGPSFGCH